MNTLFEMQSEYHDNEKSQIKDENKRIFAESLGYIVKYVDVRTDNVFDFIKQIDSTASIDDIIQSVDLSLITNSHIVQFDTDNNVVNIFKGGLPEIKNRLGYSMTSISRACNGVNYGSGHFSHGYLWHKKSDYNNRDIQTITEYQIHQSTIKENKYIYIANNGKEQITANTSTEMAKLINSNPSLIIGCVNGRRTQTRGYKITRICQDVDGNIIDSKSKLITLE